MVSAIRSRLLLAVLGTTLASSAIACGGSDASDDVSTSKMAVHKRDDGTPTGNGKTCSWAGTIGSHGSNPDAPIAGEYGQGSTPPAPRCGGAGLGTRCALPPPGIEPDAPAPNGPPPPSSHSPMIVFDEEYELGAWFGALDGCNRCTCTEIGIMCTVLACAPQEPIEPPPPPSGAGCTDAAGVRHPVGSSFPMGDGCNSCFCGTDGNIGCTEKSCQLEKQ